VATGKQEAHCTCPWQRANRKPTARATGNGQRATGNGQRATGNGQRANRKPPSLQLLSRSRRAGPARSRRGHRQEGIIIIYLFAFNSHYRYNLLLWTDRSAAGDSLFVFDCTEHGAFLSLCFLKTEDTVFFRREAPFLKEAAVQSFFALTRTRRGLRLHCSAAAEAEAEAEAEAVVIT
jgi:hypothetical protein